MDYTLETKIIKLAKKDISEFATLYQETVSDVFRYVYSLARNKDTAEDVTSQTYLQAMKKLQTYTSQGKPFKAWLFIIARNMLFQEFNKHKRTRPLEEEHEDIASETSEAITLDDLIREADIEKVRSALRELSQEIQEVVYLKTEAEMSFEEIAEIQSISLSAAKMRYYRGIEMIKNKVSQGNLINQHSI